MLRRFIVSTFVISTFSAFGIQHSALTQSGTATHSLSLYLLGHRIGTEQDTFGDTSLISHFEYLDRGTKVALDSTLTFGREFTPLSFESHGKSYRYFSVDASVSKASGAPAAFTIEGV